MIKFSRFLKASEIPNTVDYCFPTIGNHFLLVILPLLISVVCYISCKQILPGQYLFSPVRLPSMLTLLKSKTFLINKFRIKLTFFPLFTSSRKAIAINPVVPARKMGIIQDCFLTLHRVSVTKPLRCSGIWSYSFTIVSTLVQAFLPLTKSCNSHLICLPISCQFLSFFFFLIMPPGFF